MNKKSWKEFHETGLLWWINRALHLFGWTLHLFGWTIVFVIEDTGEISDVYPARCSFRGFNQLDEDEGFRKLTGYMEKSAAELNRELDRDV
jgi:hypothetical protein